MSVTFTAPGSTTASRFTGSMREDAVEAIESDDHGLAARERAGGESGARAASDERACSRASRRTTSITCCCVCGKDGEAGAQAIARQPVRAVGRELARPRQHASLADDRRRAARRAPRCRSARCARRYFRSARCADRRLFRRRSRSLRVRFRVESHAVSRKRARGSDECVRASLP